MPDDPDSPMEASDPVRTTGVLGFRFIATAAGCALVGGLILVAFVSGGVSDGIAGSWSSLTAAPAPIYFGVMSIALLAPVPASLFYLTAGPLYGIGESLLWIAPALAFNTLLVHMIASSTLRPALERMFERTGRRLPRMAATSDQTLLILLVRITPGIPYFVQSWVLGFAGVKRLPFILLSVSIQMVYAAGFVILGRSAFEGRVGLAVGAIALLILAACTARLAHVRLASATTVDSLTESGTEG